MHDPPPSVYNSWPAPNYIDPVTRGAALTIINSSVAAIAIFIVAARCYTRLKITGSFGLDDVFICLALIPSLGLTGCTLAMERVFGWNRHIWDATPEQIHGGLILEFATGVLYIQASLLTKLSVIFFCRRLISDSHPSWYRRALDYYAVATFIGNMAYTLTFCLSCQPLSGYWDGFPPTWKPDYPYHCIDIGMLWLSGSILNVSWDLLTWLVPFPIVVQLHLPLRQRIAVMTLFALGLAVVAAGVMKTYYVQITFNESYDITWTGYPSWICGALEIDIGILCASTPALRPLISHFCPRPHGGRWLMRKSYSRMSKGRDSMLEQATPLSPLNPAHLKLDTQLHQGAEMKPWSRGRSARNSISKIDISPVSPTSSAPLISPGSRILTPLSPLAEIIPESGNGAAVVFNRTPVLLSPAEEATRFDLGEREKMQTPMSLVSARDSQQSFKFASTKSVSSFDTAASQQVRPVRNTDSPVSRRSHSRKPSATTEFEGFNFNVPATSSRRASGSTAPPPSYGDNVN